ncbi:hypothetical protein HUJ05_011318 [Dendroctonus ponderosae]|nr:hypothetical protein HUJ05_011318 [Dendroctonus ponderosae]
MTFTVGKKRLMPRFMGVLHIVAQGGGGIVNHLKKSYSLSDLSDPADGIDEGDILVSDPHLIRRRKQGRSPHRSSSASSASVYFAEVNVGLGREPITEVRSTEDISSGYSSAEGLYAAQHPLRLQSRESIGSNRANSLTRSRSTRVTRSSVPKKANITSDDSDDNEVFDTNIVFFNDKAKEINNLPESHDSSSSEEFFDTPEMIGFDLHGKTLIDTSRIEIENNQRIVDSSSSIIPNALAVVKRNPIDSDASGGNHRTADVLGYDTDSKITACPKEISSSPLRLNLTKLSSALSSLYPLSLKAPAGTSNESMNLQINYRKPEMAKCVSGNPFECDELQEIQPQKISSQPDSIAKGADKKAGGNDEAVNRGGKYHKKHAPLPPRPPRVQNLPIKATLVLQPGVVRSLSSSAESLNKEVFLNYSPKMRRPRNASSSSKSSESSSSMKSDNALSKMLRLPKKMAHLNIPSKVKEKRHSWGDFFHNKPLAASGKNAHSRSASSLDAIAENPTTEAAKPIQRAGSQVSIRSLTDSPLAHRRSSQVPPYPVLKNQQKRGLYETEV